MGLELVVEDVLVQGRAEAEAIRAVGRAEHNRMVTEARAEGAQVLSGREDEGRRVAERIRVRELARADLESKKIILAAQKDVLEEVYQGVLRRLRSIPDAGPLLRSLLERNRAEWSGGRVLANASDAATVQVVVGKSFGGIIDCVGGLVIESADGSRRIDLRFESVLADVWTNVIREVANVLWPPA